MKQPNYLTITAVILLSAAILAGCGSDDETLTQAQFTEQANTICIEADAKIGEALGPIFSGEPTPDQLQEALDEIITTSRETSSSLANLAAPTDISDDVDNMIAAFNAANDEAEGQGLAFFEEEGDPWAPVGAMAGKLGLDGCASE